MPENVLFVCIGNSCRSQMAQGFVNSIYGGNLCAYSAGIRPSRLVDPLAVKVMDEVGIDISKHKAKSIESLSDLSFDYVVTVCDSGEKECPYIPALRKKIHHGFPDPPKLSAKMHTSEEKLSIYRRVRDEIYSFVKTLPEWFEQS